MIVFLAQKRSNWIIGKLNDESEYVNKSCTGIDEEKIKKRERLIRIDYYLTQTQIGITTTLIAILFYLMLHEDGSGECGSPKKKYLWPILFKTFVVIGD